MRTQSAAVGTSCTRAHSGAQASAPQQEPGKESDTPLPGPFSLPEEIGTETEHDCPVLEQNIVQRVRHRSLRERCTYIPISTTRCPAALGKGGSDMAHTDGRSSNEAGRRQTDRSSADHKTHERKRRRRKKTPPFRSY